MDLARKGDYCLGCGEFADELGVLSLIVSGHYRVSIPLDLGAG